MALPHDVTVLQGVTSVEGACSGYADIDPDLAWEQWCVVRANRTPGGD
jgi:hypothetical protein